MACCATKRYSGQPRSIASRAWSASAEPYPIDRARPAIGRRSRRKPGLRGTGSDGGYSNRDQGPSKCWQGDPNSDWPYRLQNGVDADRWGGERVTLDEWASVTGAGFRCLANHNAQESKNFRTPRRPGRLEDGVSERDGAGNQLSNAQSARKLRPGKAA